MNSKKKAVAGRKLWSIIEMLRFRRDLTESDLAAIGHTTVRTVGRDKADPMKMPLERFFRYLGLELTADEIITAILKAIAEKGVKE